MTHKIISRDRLWFVFRTNKAGDHILDWHVFYAPGGRIDHDAVEQACRRWGIMEGDGQMMTFHSSHLGGVKEYINKFFPKKVT